MNNIYSFILFCIFIANCTGAIGTAIVHEDQLIVPETLGQDAVQAGLQKAGGIDFKLPILLGYTGLTDVLLQKYIKDSRLLWEDAAESLRYTSIGSVVGTHTGPGVIAAAFFRK